MLLERLDGRSPAKVVGAKNFHDIGYLRDLLFNVFTALDVGQRRMGALRAGAAVGCMCAGVGTVAAGTICRRPGLSVGSGARGALRQCQAPCWQPSIFTCCYAWWALWRRGRMPFAMRPLMRLSVASSHTSSLRLHLCGCSGRRA